MRTDVGDVGNDASRAELPSKLDSLRELIQLGIDQLDRGEGEPLDMDEIRSEIQRRINETKTQ